MDLIVENPFADLMNKAVKLKGAQQAQLRTQLDSWPQYFQHSMFMQESVTSVRELAFPERIEAAESMKAKGNEHYSSNDLEEAVTECEKALAVFKYIENSDPGWKKKGIEDRDLQLFGHKCDSREDQTRLDALKMSCYLNIAVSKFKLKDYPVCIRACDDTLLIDPTSVKAYYRRAQALITPSSSGALEFDQAIVDLEKAHSTDPSNKDVRKLLRELKERRVRQKKLDKETFSGMFGRGQVYGEQEDPPTPPIEELDGDAARERKFEKETTESVLVDGSESQNGDFSASVQSIDSILKSMTNAQIAQMLAREGIDYHKITDRDQFLETARQVLETKLNSSPTPETKSYFVPIFLMAAAWTILRLYTTGGLSFLFRLVVHSFIGENIEDRNPTAGVEDLFGE